MRDRFEASSASATTQWTRSRIRCHLERGLEAVRLLAPGLRGAEARSRGRRAPGPDARETVFDEAPLCRQGLRYPAFRRLGTPDLFAQTDVRAALSKTALGARMGSRRRLISRPFFFSHPCLANLPRVRNRAMGECFFSRGSQFYSTSITHPSKFMLLSSSATASASSLEW